MKTFQKTPLALAIAALLASPLVLANDSRGDVDVDAEVDTEVDAEWENEVEVELDYEADVEKDYEVKARLYIHDFVDPEAYSSATVDSKQINSDNKGDNEHVTNNATVNGNALNGASGNIGVNNAAGDNNQQANDAALAAVDADLVFAHANAYSLQSGTNNNTWNDGVVNNATLGGNALQNAAGNIGVNVAAGNSNLQQNSLAASVNTSGNVADATAAGMQQAIGNHTSNEFVQDEITTTTTTSVSGTLAGPTVAIGFGEYEGTSDQIGNLYLDTWDGPLPHPNGNSTGHIDLDDQVQGAQDLNDDGGALAFNEEGTLGFIELGYAALSGTLSGTVQHTQVIYIAHENNATLGGNALAGAQGNIGVNVAAGSNNMQRNSMAIASAMGGGGEGGGGGAE